MIDTKRRLNPTLSAILKSRKTQRSATDITDLRSSSGTQTAANTAGNFVGAAAAASIFAGHKTGSSTGARPDPLLGRAEEHKKILQDQLAARTPRVETSGKVLTEAVDLFISPRKTRTSPKRCSTNTGASWPGCVSSARPEACSPSKR